MSTELLTLDHLPAPIPADRIPVLVYLARLAPHPLWVTTTPSQATARSCILPGEPTAMWSERRCTRPAGTTRTSSSRDGRVEPAGLSLRYTVYTDDWGIYSMGDCGDEDSRRCR